jgi:hypothetical protein
MSSVGDALSDSVRECETLDVVVQDRELLAVDVMSSDTADECEKVFVTENAVEAE